MDEYGDVGFIPILMCDDDVLLCRVCDVMLLSHIHCIGDEGFYAKRRGLLCQSDDGLLCRMSLIMDKSDGYHMHNIVVSHGVGYVYF